MSLDCHCCWVLRCWSPNLGMTLFICSATAVILIGKINEMVAVVLDCELGKSLSLCGSQFFTCEKGARRASWLNESAGWTNVLQTLLSDVAERCTLLALLPAKTAGHCSNNRVMLDVLKAQLCFGVHLGLGHAAFLVNLFPRHEDCPAPSGSTTCDISAICGADIPSNRRNETGMAAAIRFPLCF